MDPQVTIKEEIFDVSDTTNQRLIKREEHSVSSPVNKPITTKIKSEYIGNNSEIICPKIEDTVDDNSCVYEMYEKMKHSPTSNTNKDYKTEGVIEKPYKCDVYNYAATRRSDSSRHKKRHTGEKF